MKNNYLEISEYIKEMTDKCSMLSFRKKVVRYGKVDCLYFVIEALCKFKGIGFDLVDMPSYNSKEEAVCITENCDFKNELESRGFVVKDISRSDIIDGDIIVFKKIPYSCYFYISDKMFSIDLLHGVVIHDLSWFRDTSRYNIFRIVDFKE